MATLTQQFNQWVAVKITGAVSTMTCAYIFAGLALVSLPDAIHNGRAAIISWIAQTFLQLVLLSIILVGQKLRADELKAGHEAIHDHLDGVHAHIESATGVARPE